VCVGTDPVSGQVVQRSVTVRGNLAIAEQQRALLAAQAQQLRARGQRPLRTVGDLLEVWLTAEHDWKPSTWQGYRQAARLSTDSRISWWADSSSPGLWTRVLPVGGQLISSRAAQVSSTTPLPARASASR
jgi:hypothetical protein